MAIQVIRLLVVFLFSSAAFAGQRPGVRLYLNVFQSGTLLTFDLATMTVVNSTPVQDASGSMGLGVTADGKRLFIVDGDTQHRLRTVDTVTGKVLKQYFFNDRVLLLGGGPVIHLTADDRWLFLQTYSYGAAASGVRIFNVEAGSFTPLGLRGRACRSPRLTSARTGALVAICPNLAYETMPLPGRPGEFIPGIRVSMAIAQVADVALSPDGRDLYVLENIRDRAPWRLMHWEKGHREVDERDLRQLLDVSAKSQGSGGRAWLDVSPDGKWLGIAHGHRIWIFERQGMKLLHTLDLPGSLEQIAFTPDSQELISLRGAAGGSDIQDALMFRVFVKSGNLEQVRLAGFKIPRSPTIFKVAVAP